MGRKPKAEDKGSEVLPILSILVQNVSCSFLAQSLCSTLRDLVRCRRRGADDLLGGGSLRDFHEEVEVVRHEAVGADAQSAEFLVDAHELEEMVLFCITEQELRADDARDAVEEGDRQILRATETGTTPDEERKSGFTHEITSL